MSKSSSTRPHSQRSGRSLRPGSSGPCHPTAQNLRYREVLRRIGHIGNPPTATMMRRTRTRIMMIATTHLNYRPHLSIQLAPRRPRANLTTGPGHGSPPAEPLSCPPCPPQTRTQKPLHSNGTGGTSHTASHTTRSTISALATHIHITTAAP